jgi:serine/threonine-protein kinase HipA
MRRCLFCYNALHDEEIDYHAKCSRRFFGSASPPEFPYTIDQITSLAEQVVKRQVTVPGVQPKLSLHLEKYRQSRTVGTGARGIGARLTIVGLWGGYIFKPPTSEYPELPEIEDLTMHLAELAGIETVPHSLIRFRSGELAYITRRIDRGAAGEKIHMEDMCQLTERLTEEKYHGSMEQIGKVISEHSSNPGLDAINFFEVALFCYLTGNADMHLKNFSLIHTATHDEAGVGLTPAYDLIATRLLIPTDREEMALSINGRKAHLRLRDFQALAGNLRINEKASTSSHRRLQESVPALEDFIRMSFISEGKKDEYIKLIRSRGKILFGTAGSP